MMADLQMSNLEKTLLAWCRYSVKDYEGVGINNFTSSWSDGLAFNAVIHRWRPNLFDWDFVSKRHPNARLEHAFRTAKNHLKIERLLDPEDVNNSSPDKKSILIYVLCLFQALPHEGMELPQPEEPPTSNSDLASYHVLLEEVLVWLLASGDKIEAMAPVATDLKNLKNQFHELEQFLIELTQQQGSIGEAIQEGHRLLRNTTMPTEEFADVTLQMKMLTDRWESLRLKAMNRQSIIHKSIMEMQKSKLITFRDWLRDCEDQISRLGNMPQDISVLEKYLGYHTKLKEFLDEKQTEVEDLSKLIVVVDDKEPDAGAHLEDELNALGERWIHVCRWSRERWPNVEGIMQAHSEVKDILMRTKERVQTSEQALKMLEANIDVQYEQEEKLLDLEKEVKTLVSELLRLDGLIQKLSQALQLLFQGKQPKEDLPSKIPKAVPKISLQYTEEIENLQDKLDALMDIVDIQKQRIAMLGSPKKKRREEVIHQDKVKMAQSMEDIGLSEMDTDDQLTNSMEKMQFHLNTVNTILQSEVPLISLSASFNAILSEYKNIFEKTGTFQDDLDLVYDKSNRRDTFHSLLQSWEDSHVKLADRIKGLEESLSTAKCIFDDCQSLMNWVQEVEGFLKAEDIAYGDIEALAAQLEQCNELKDDIPTLSATVQRIDLNLHELIPKCDGTLTADLTRQVSLVKNNFENLVNEIQKKCENLKVVLENTNLISEEINALTAPVNSIYETVVSLCDCSIRNTKELNDQVKALNDIKVKVDGISEKMSRLDKSKGQFLPEPCRMKDVCETLLSRWTYCTERVKELNHLKHLLRCYDDFKVLLAQESDWLSKLERKLKKQDENTGDAEELSEELDDLENLMKNYCCDTIEKMKTLVDSVSEANFTEHLIGIEFSQLSTRWHKTTEEARQRIIYLDNSIKEIQDFQQEIMQLQDWILALDSDLTTELRHDLTSEDAPGDSKRFTVELSQQEATLIQLEKRVTCHSNSDIVNKFGDHLKEIKQCLLEVSVKLKHFTDPPLFEQRLDRLTRILRDFENKMAFIELASDDPEAIESQLCNCLKFYEELREVKSEVEEVLREGRKLVDENAVDDAESLTQHLDCLKALYNQLGEEVATARSNLEEASSLSVRLQSDFDVMTTLLTEIEDGLNRREPNTLVNNFEEEISFCKESAEKLVTHENVMTRISEDFQTFCGLCDPAFLEGTGTKTVETAERVQRLQVRLNSRLGMIQEMSLAKEGPLSVEHKKVSREESFPIQEEGDYDNVESCGYSNQAFDDNDDEATERSSQSVGYQRFVTTIIEDDENSSIVGDDSSSASSLSSDDSIAKSPDVTPSSKKSHFMEVMPSEMGLNESIDDVTTSQMSVEEISQVVTQLTDLISQSNEKDKMSEILSDVVKDNIPKSPIQAPERKKSVSFSPNDSIVEIEPLEDENECQVVEVKEKEIVVNSIEITKDIIHEICLTDVEIATSRLPSVERAEMELVHYIPSSPEIDEALDSPFESEKDIADGRRNVSAAVHLSAITTLSLGQNSHLSENNLSTLLSNLSKEEEMDKSSSSKLSRDYYTQTQVSDIQVANRQSTISQMTLSLSESEKESDVSHEKDVATPRSIYDLSITPDSGRGGFSKSDEYDNDDLESFYASDKETDDIVEFSSSEAVTPAEYLSDSETETDTPVTSPRKMNHGVSPKVLRQRLQSLDSPTSPSVQPPIGELSDFKSAIKLMLERLKQWHSVSHEVGDWILLEPDVAQLISQGDTLVFKIQDVSSAGSVLALTNQLRRSWTEVKSLNKPVKVNDESLLFGSQNKIQELELWLSEISGILNKNQALTGEQLDLIQDRIVEKQADIRKLNDLALELCARNSAEQEETLQKLNNQWLDLNVQCQIFQLSKMVGVDFLTRITRAREAIASLRRQMLSPPLSLKDYEQLSAQETSLKAIRENLAILQPTISQLFLDGNQLLKPERETDATIAKLDNEWDLINQFYTEKSSRWSKASDLWRSIHSDIKSIEAWFAEIQIRIKLADDAEECAQERMKISQEIEKNSRLMARITTLCREIASKCSLADAGMLRAKLETLCQTWSEINVAFDNLPKTTIQTLEMEKEAILRWAESTLHLLEERINPLDEIQLSAALRVAEERQGELDSKRNFLRVFATLDSTKAEEAKAIESKLNEVRNALMERLNLIGNRHSKASKFLVSLDETMDAVAAQLNATSKEVIDDDYPDEVAKRVEELLLGYSSLQDDCKKENYPIPPDIQTKIDFLHRMRRPNYKMPSSYRRNMSYLKAPKVTEFYPATASASLVEEPSNFFESKSTVEVITVEPQTASVVTGTNKEIKVTSLDDSRKASLASLRSFTPQKLLHRATSPESLSPEKAPLLASLDKSILQIRDWLTVLESNVKKNSIIIGDADDVRNVLEKQKNVLRELEQKKPQLDDLVEAAEGLKRDSARHNTHGKDLDFSLAQNAIYHVRTVLRVSKLREHWDDTSSAVSSRAAQLEEILVETNRFEAKRLETEAWMARMESKISRLPPVGQTVDLLDSQTREQKALHSEVSQFRAQLDQVTSAVHALATNYPYEDATRIKATAESLGQRYAALVSSVTTRGKALNAAFGTLHHLDRSLDRFMAWLSDAESMLESVECETEPGGHRATPERIFSKIKELTAEINGRKEEHAGLSAAGQRLLSTLESTGPDKNPEDAAMLRRRLEDINRRWHTLRAKSVAIRNRLENNREHWNAVLLSLRELIEWVIRKDMELTSLGPLRADLLSLTKQQDDFRAFKRQLEDKRTLIEQNILTGKQLISSEPPLADSEDLEGRDLAGDSRGYPSAGEAARELTRSLKSETTKLSERWVALRDRTERWGISLEETLSKLKSLQSNIDDATSRLIGAEKTKANWIRPADIDPIEISTHLEKLRMFSDSLTPVQEIVDEINDAATRLADNGLPVSHSNLSRIDELNTRWRLLQSSLDERYQQLSALGGATTGIGGQNFLVVSVDHPWERALMATDVPYYINHQTETTHWDHPRLDAIMNELTTFNDVRYSAYRTGLKLRHIQKALELHQIPLSSAIETFDAHGLRSRNEGVITVNEIVTVLRSMYSKVNSSLQINLPLSVDLCLNWILNLFDCQRSGEVQILSFKVGICLLTNGHLDDKYKYLFRLVANEQRQADSSGISSLLDACMQVPKELGEINSFGGSNTEPSVRSCIQKAGKDKTTIEVVHFMSWLKAEPQSLVWLPVLHRISASEMAKHQAKCNICKMSPIVGLRYRCLKCFNFDLCQSCFFSGKIAKHHKLSHPMHEYCSHSTSGEDIKDFTKALKNKFKSKKYFQKHQKLGYLPVQLENDSANQSTAGDSTTSGQITPSMSNLDTPQSTGVGEDVHARLELYASRLAEAESHVDGGTPSRTSLTRDLSPDSEDEHALIAQYCRSLTANSRNERSSERLDTNIGPKSPAQLIAAIDQSHKEELESMIRELEEENASLQAEYERLRGHQSPSLSMSSTSDPNQSLDGIVLTTDTEREMLAEARMLRQHKARLEARMNILEEHNKQLEAQLARLRKLLAEPVPSSSPSRSGTLQTRAVTASQLATDIPYRVNGHEHHESSSRLSTEALSDSQSLTSRDSRSASRPPPPPMARGVGNLFSMVDDLGKAVGSLVAVMNDENGGYSDSDTEH
ncbi:utrophin-like isoform X3 [Artemia franciscana]